MTRSLEVFNEERIKTIAAGKDPEFIKIVPPELLNNVFQVKHSNVFYFLHPKKKVLIEVEPCIRKIVDYRIIE